VLYVNSMLMVYVLSSLYMVYLYLGLAFTFMDVLQINFALFYTLRI
jgi:hypothetical protein